MSRIDAFHRSSHQPNNMKLVVYPNTAQAREIELKPGYNSIGRSEANDVPITDASVSGSHCNIIVSDGDVPVQDLVSTNGTFMNAARVGNARLDHGASLKFGGVPEIFSSDVAVAAPAAMESAPKPAGLRI